MLRSAHVSDVFLFIAHISNTIIGDVFLVENMRGLIWIILIRCGINFILEKMAKCLSQLLKMFPTTFSRKKLY